MLAGMDSPSNAIEQAMVNQLGVLCKAVKKLMEWLERIDQFRNLTSVASYFIPKGSHVLLSRLGLGRNPRIWEEPLNFNPEQHLNASTVQVVELNEPNLRFISFSARRRGCTGMAFGSTIAVMLLAMLFQGLTWSLPPGQQEIDFLKSRNDLSLLQNLCMPQQNQVCVHH